MAVRKRPPSRQDSQPRQDSQQGRLQLIPLEHRLPALIFLVVESVLLGLAYSGIPSVKLTAIIGMIILATIGLILILFFVPRASRNVSKQELEEKVEQVKQLEKQAEKVSKTFEQELIERYGVRADSASVTVEILDLAGACRITRSWKGFKVSPNVEIPHFPGKEVINTPGGRITQPSMLIDTEDFPKNVSLVHTRIEDKLCMFQVKILGSLVNSDPPLNYTHRVEIERAFLMTREETSQHYKDDYLKNEYFYLETYLPIERMDIEVRFPNGYEVQAFPGVFFGEFEFIHNSEFNRVKNGFRKTIGSAHFQIDKPLVGFRYLIHWVPPSQRDVERLKQEG